MKSAFGLDLAGYSTGQSGFARADRIAQHTVQVTVYEQHVFCEKWNGSRPLEKIVEAEIKTLLSVFKHGPLFVDTPIDLQQLPAPQDAFFTWQLTKRPVDFAFEAMPPLADRIGSPMARFNNLLQQLNHENAIGHHVYETYPALALRNLGLPSSKYKNQQATFKDGYWQGHKLAEMLRELNVEAEEGISVNDDEVDAVLCALTGAVDDEHILSNEALEREIYEQIQMKTSVKFHDKIPRQAPQGFVVLKSFPSVTIQLRKLIDTEYLF